MGLRFKSRCRYILLYWDAACQLQPLAGPLGTDGPNCTVTCTVLYRVTVVQILLRLGFISQQWQHVAAARLTARSVCVHNYKFFLVMFFFKNEDWNLTPVKRKCFVGLKLKFQNLDFLTVLLVTSWKLYLDDSLHSKWSFHRAFLEYWGIL